MTRLRGRGAELHVLRESVDNVVAGRGGVVLVHGAPGTGLTSLLDTGARMAAAAGARVLRAQGRRDSGSAPLEALLDALLAPPDPWLDPAALREAMTMSEQTVTARLERAATEAPALVVVDDVRRGDGPTLAALESLADRLSGRRLGWVIAVRGGRGEADAHRSAAEERQVLALRPLEPSAVAQIVEDHLGAVPDPALADLASGLSGHPSLLVELLRGLREEDGMTITDGVARVAPGPLPGRLVGAVAALVEALPIDARELLRMASVLPRATTLDELAELVGCAPGDLRAPVSAALDAGLLAGSSDGQLGFACALIAESVRSGLTSALLQALRRRAVAVLQRRGAPELHLALLVQHTAVPGDRAAVSVLLRAVEGVRDTAPQTATALARRALALTAPDDPDRATVAAQSLPLLVGAGALGEAGTLVDDATRAALGASEDARLRLALAHLGLQTSSADVVAHCDQGMAAGGVPAGLRRRLGAARTFGLVLEGDLPGARAAVDSDLATARAAQATTAALAALCSRSLVCVMTQELDEAAQAAGEAGVLARGDQQEEQLWPALWQAWLPGLLGRPCESLERIDEEAKAARRDGRRRDVWWWSSVKARVLLSAGRLEEARLCAESLLPAGAGPVTGPMRHGAIPALAGVAVHTGEPGAVAAATAAAEAMRGHVSLTARRSGAWIAARLADADGEPGRAMALLSDTVSALGTPTPMFCSPQDPTDLTDLMRIALRAGDRASARRVADEAQRRIGRNPGCALTHRLSAHILALLADDADALRDVAQHHDAFPGALTRAKVLEDAADALARRDRHHDRSGAIALLDDAHKRWAELGAERDAARVRRRLRDLGVRRSPTTRPAPAPSWAGLTDAELAVVQHVATGATNRQAAERLFLSPHTVSTHLRHAFQKLAITSRVELAVLVAQRRLGEPA